MYEVIGPDRLERVSGGKGGLWQEWGPDIKGALVPGGSGVVAGALCFGGISLALGGSFLVPPSAPAWATVATHLGSYACSGTAATVVHHMMK